MGEVLDPRRGFRGLLGCRSRQPGKLALCTERPARECLGLMPVLAAYHALWHGWRRWNLCRPQTSTGCREAAGRTCSASMADLHGRSLGPAWAAASCWQNGKQTCAAPSSATDSKRTAPRGMQGRCGVDWGSAGPPPPQPPLLPRAAAAAACCGLQPRRNQGCVLARGRARAGGVRRCGRAEGAAASTLA